MERGLSILRRGQIWCWLFSTVTAIVVPSAVMAQTTGGAPPRQGAPNSGTTPATAPRPATVASLTRIDANFITSDADVVVVLRPAQILSSPNAAVLPIEVAAAAGLKYLGQNVADMDEVIAFAKKPKPAVEPIEYGITIKFNKPFNGGALPQEVRGHAKTAELNGKKYLQSEDPVLPSFYAPDTKTLIVAPDATVRKILDRKAPTQPRPFYNRVRGAMGGNDIYIAVDVTTFRDDLQFLLTSAQSQAQSMTQLPPGLEKLFTAPGLINAMEGTFNLSNSSPSGLLVHANDAAAADQLDKSMADLVKLIQDTQASLLAANEDPVQKALTTYKQRMAGGLIKSLRPEKNGSRLTFFRSEGPPSQQTLTLISYVGVLAAEIAPMAASMGPGMAGPGMGGPGMRGMPPGMPNMGMPPTAGAPAGATPAPPSGMPAAQPGVPNEMPGGERQATTTTGDSQKDVDAFFGTQSTPQQDSQSRPEPEQGRGRRGGNRGR